MVRKILITILAFTFAVSLTSCTGTNERDVAECDVCGKKYYSGDAGGNYMQISYSGMCNKCHDNFETINEIKDYIDLNY